MEVGGAILWGSVTLSWPVCGCFRANPPATADGPAAARWPGS